MRIDRFNFKTRYFTDSGVIGTKKFVSRHYERFREYFQAAKGKTPRAIDGLERIFSLKACLEI